MTQYNTNADFSTDAAATSASADSTDGDENNITGYTAITTDTTGHQFTWTITSGGGEGANYCVYSSAGATARPRFLKSDDMTVGTGTEFDILTKIRLPSGASITGTDIFLLCWNSTNSLGYSLRVHSDSDLQLYEQNGSNIWNPVGARIDTKSFTAGTWYWLRVHRTDSVGGYKWSWGLDTSIPTGWDVGDGGSGGVANSFETAFDIGVGGFDFADDVHYDWFSSADAGHSAPSPSGGASVAPLAMYHYQHNTG